MARHVTDEERERARKGGEWLRAERKRRGYETVAELADALGIKQGRLSTYENGQFLVDRAVAKRIAEVFGITEWEAWVGLRIPQPAPPDAEAIARAWELLPEVMERVTGGKRPNPPPVPKDTPSRRRGGTRPGDKRRNADQGEESTG